MHLNAPNWILGVEQTGLLDLSMLFFEVVHVAALPEVVPITQDGAKHKAKAFPFQLEAGQAGNLFNALDANWFNDSVTAAIRIPDGFASIIAGGDWRFLGLPLFDYSVGVKGAYGWPLHLHIFGVDEAALIAHSVAEQRELDDVKDDEATNLFDSIPVKQFVKDLRQFTPSVEQDSSRPAQRMRTWVVRFQRHAFELAAVGG